MKRKVFKINDLDIKLLNIYSLKREVFLLYEYKGEIKSYLGRINKYDLVYSKLEIKRKMIPLENIICFKEVK